MSIMLNLSRNGSAGPVTNAATIAARTGAIAGAIVLVAALCGPARAQTRAPDLGALEQRLSSSPDSLEAANAYRHAVMETAQYDRALRFFEQLVTANPRAANAYLNYGFAYVDKIPAAGAITQVILANSALTQFTKSIELRPSWIGYYTRGSSYLFWPKIFGRAPLGIADLEEALRLQQKEPKRAYHVRTYIALGDGYWKNDAPDRARAIWQEGLTKFPDCAPLQTRLRAAEAPLATLIEQAFDPTKRVDTDLSALWSEK